MAHHLFCSFLYFRSLSTTSNLPLFFPSTQYLSSALHSHNSRNSRVKRSLPHFPLLFKSSPFGASASDIVVISTQEHSDGSLLFRFGDPSEVEKDVEMEESKIGNEGVEGEEDTIGSSKLKVMGGEYETEVTPSVLTVVSECTDPIVKEGIEGEEDKNRSSTLKVTGGKDETEVTPSLLTEVSELTDSIVKEEIEGEEDTNGSTMVKVMKVKDETEVTTSGLTMASERTNSIVTSSNTLITVEEESEFSEEACASIVDIESHVLTSDREIQSICNIDKIEGSIPAESSTVENTIVEESYEESLMETFNITCTTKEMDNITIAGVDLAQQAVDIEECLNKDDMEECLKREDVEEISNEEDLDSPAEASVLNQSSEVMKDTTTVALLDKENDHISTADIDVEEGVDGDYEDLFVDAFVLDKISVVGNDISPVDLLEKETNGHTFTSDIEIEPNWNVEEGIDEEYEDSPVEISSAPDTNTAALSQNISAEIISAPDANTVEQGQDEVFVGPSLAPIYRPDERPKVDIDITAQEVSEKGTSVNVEQGLDEILEELSSVDASRPDERPEAEKYITAKEEVLERETAADNTSAPDIRTVELGRDEIIEEPSSMDASRSNERTEVNNYITAQEILEKDTTDITSALSTAIVERGHDEDFKEPSLVDAYRPDERSEAENCVTAQEGLEKDTAADSNSAPDIGIGEQGLDEVFKEPSLVDASRSNERPEAENITTAQEFLEEEAGGETTLVALVTDPVVSVLDTNAGQGGVVIAVTTNVVPIFAETTIHDDTTVGKRESFDGDLVPPSFESEPAMSLCSDTELSNLQAETQNLVTEESNENDVDKTVEGENVATEESNETDVDKAVEIQNVINEDYESEMYGAEDEPRTTGPAMIWSEEETVTETVDEPREDDGSEEQTLGGDLIEALVHEVAAPDSTESTIMSQEILKTGYMLCSGAALLPHPLKVFTGGEDAYFIANQIQTWWIGVGDGVGQWSLEGTIPGVYAHELIKNCEKSISDGRGSSINNPLELLTLAVAQTHTPGSSTALIARFDGQALDVANIGDSGFIILRHGAVYKRSSPMHHVFSLPVQIARGDDPSSLAQLYRVDLEEDDIIVTATDGLLDNLYAQEILLAIKSLSHDKTPQEIAEVLAKRAQEVGSSAVARSPFADEAQAAGFPGYSGGRLGDVAVIVSVVRRR